jgi:hypothetical protein
MGNIRPRSLESLIKMEHFQKEPPQNLKGTGGTRAVEWPMRTFVERTERTLILDSYGTEVSFLCWPNDKKKRLLVESVTRDANVIGA